MFLDAKTHARLIKGTLHDTLALFNVRKQTDTLLNLTFRQMCNFETNISGTVKEILWMLMSVLFHLLYRI